MLLLCRPLAYLETSFGEPEPPRRDLGGHLLFWDT